LLSTILLSLLSTFLLSLLSTFLRANKIIWKSHFYVERLRAYVCTRTFFEIFSLFPIQWRVARFFWSKNTKMGKIYQINTNHTKRP
jgi:hypothetical protein